MEINIRLANSTFANKSRVKEERIEQEIKISKKYNFFKPLDDPAEQTENVALTSNAENISEKIKGGDNYKEFEPKIAEEIESEVAEENGDCVNAGLEENIIEIKATCQKEEKELGDLYDEIVQGKKPLDPEIEELFIDNNKIFESDDISEDDKKFILDSVDRTDFSFNTKIFDQDDDATTVDYNMETNDLDKVATVDYNNENNDVGWHNSLETIQEAKEDDLREGRNKC